MLNDLIYIDLNDEIDLEEPKEIKIEPKGIENEGIENEELNSILEEIESEELNSILEGIEYELDKLIEDEETEEEASSEYDYENSIDESNSISNSTDNTDNSSEESNSIKLVYCKYCKEEHVYKNLDKDKLKCKGKYYNTQFKSYDLRFPPYIPITYFS